MTTPLIECNGVDVTDDVLFETAEFTTFVNGTPGTCQFWIRDLDHTRSLTTGKSLVLKIDGDNAWTGYISKISRAFAFPAEETTIASEVPRFLVVEGSDINILFRKRVVFNTANPVAEWGKLYTYPPVTADDTAIGELVTNWLDLSGDSLDVSTQVVNVGNINVDQDVVPWQGGWIWEQAMASIARLPAAIYYLNPDRELVYVDVDAPDAPYALSDTPTGTDAGYREIQIIEDGTNLVTDIMEWGMGTGRNRPVFKRIESDPDGHGLWQLGELQFNVYKQATIDKVADSIINGSPGSRRGHKRDKVSIECVTFVPGFRAGHKVDFSCNAWGFTDVIPIRALQITFPAPDTPKFKLNLSHEIDQPWSFYDIFSLKFSMPDWPDQSLPSWPSDGCVPDPTAITDTFSRVEGPNAWGTADSGQTWVRTGASGVGTVNGVMGLLTTFSDTDPQKDNGFGLPTSGSPLFGRIKFNCDHDLTSFDDPGAPFGYRSSLMFAASVRGNTVSPIRSTQISIVHYGPLSGMSGTWIRFLGQTTFEEVACPIPIIKDTWYWLAFEMTTGATLRAKVWAVGSPEASTWVTSTVTTSATNVLTQFRAHHLTPATFFLSGVGQTLITRWDDLCIGPACGEVCTYGAGEISEVPTVSGDTLILAQPFFKGTTHVWQNGLILTLGTDYTETAPLDGIITLAVTPGGSDTFIVSYRVSSETGGSGITILNRRVT